MRGADFSLAYDRLYERHHRKIIILYYLYTNSLTSKRIFYHQNNAIFLLGRYFITYLRVIGT